MFLIMDDRKGLRTTCKLGKVSPRFIGPFRIYKRIRVVA